MFCFNDFAPENRLILRLKIDSQNRLQLHNIVCHTGDVFKLVLQYNHGSGIWFEICTDLALEVGYEYLNHNLAALLILGGPGMYTVPP